MIKIGINGFGRIGRLALRIAIERKNIQVVAINDVLPIDQIAYLFKYDSVHGRFKGTVEIVNNILLINSQPIKVFFESSPEKIKWAEVKADFVIESSGKFTSLEEASMHLNGGAKKVVISAPSNTAPMYVMGVNHTKLNLNTNVFSNASCTTNCLAPLVSVLHTNFEIIEGLVTTVHCTTSSQNTVDGPENSYRRGRSALNNMIPTTTSASGAVSKIIPELKGKILSMAVRVPLTDVSLIDLTVRLKKETSYSQIKQVIKLASENEFKGIIGYTEDEVVSQDFVSDPRTSIFDANAGLELNANFFKLIAWYDNEFGYSNKLLDLIEYAASIEN